MRHIAKTQYIHLRYSQKERSSKIMDHPSTIMKSRLMMMMMTMCIKSMPSLFLFLTGLLLCQLFGKTTAQDAQQHPAYPVGLAFAGRLNHLSVGAVNNMSASEFFQAFGLSAGPFPLGWPAESIPLDGDVSIVYNSTGFWLGTIALETVSWSSNSGSTMTWIAFDQPVTLLRRI
jgi:hypothetical protein